MRRKVVKECFIKLCEEICGNQRKFWIIILLFINLCKNVNIGWIIFKDNGKIIKEQNEVVEILNVYFINSVNLYYF